MTAWPVVDAVEDPGARAVAFVEVARPEVVLGSTQQVAPEIEARPDVRRRRSGGGAVWLAPGHQVWVDVAVPRGDPLWDDDVGRAFLWLGDVWAAALTAAGVGGAAGGVSGGGAAPVVHRGALVRTRWSDQVCFAGLGPGEVTLGEGGPKVVGIAQRRTRPGALFQCAVPLVWDPRPLAEVLALPPGAADELAPVAAAVPVDAASLQAAFLAALP